MPAQTTISYTNQGNIETTALLIAFEISLRNIESNSLLTTAPDLAKQVGEIAATLIAALPRRAEPNDPIPGCAEPKGETCDNGRER